MQERQLSENFILSEFTYSYVAEKHGIVNSPDAKAIAALTNLCANVLQPLRDFYRHPIRVSSGFRCKTLNRIVGGVPSSQHLIGEAADLMFPTLGVAVSWMQFISQNCPFDQMLLERSRSGAQWLHVSCRMDIKRNRKQIKLIKVPR